MEFSGYLAYDADSRARRPRRIDVSAFVMMGRRRRTTRPDNVLLGVPRLLVWRATRSKPPSTRLQKRKQNDMQRILVTGANKGIGLAIVTAILTEHDDTFVFLGARDLARGNEAARSLLETHPAWTDRLVVIELDVSQDASVSGLSSRIRERCGPEPTPLYAVVNNAGIGGSSTELTEVLKVNTLGLRRVCEACIPLIDPNQGRIVNVTSAAGPSYVSKCSPERQKLFTDPASEWSALERLISECVAIGGDADEFAARGLADGSAYGLSKACANAYTLQLARRYPNLRINACTPGFIETDLTRGYAASQGKPPAELGMLPPAAGTRAPLHLLFGDLDGNGRYYGSDAQRSPLDRYRAPGTEPYGD